MFSSIFSSDEDDVETLRALHQKVGLVFLILSPVTFFFLIYVRTAPYGKHTESASASATTSTSTPTAQRNSYWGPSINAKLAWMIFESPNLFWIVYWFLNRNEQVFESPANISLLSLFGIHYLNRCIIYPLRMSSNSSPVNLAIVSSGFVFCFMNGWLQATQYCVLHAYPQNYHKSPTFIIGAALWLTGFVINIQSDGILRALRNAPPTKTNTNASTNTYKIPYGGAFEYVSGANFFGEIVEWAGYAMASWSLAGLAFWMFVSANLIPRAYATHRWYHDKFEDYPKERKAVIPFLL